MLDMLITIGERIARNNIRNIISGIQDNGQMTKIVHCSHIVAHIKNWLLSFLVVHMSALLLVLVLRTLDYYIIIYMY